MAFKIKVLHITVGLPASGKTTWAKEQAAKAGYSRNFGAIHLDEWMMRDQFDSYSDFIESTSFRPYCRETTIIDGLFLTVANIEMFLTALNKKGMSFEKVVIHKWDIDRESCIWNDLYRREKGSGITIANGEIDMFSREQLKALKDKFNGTVFIREKHLVEKKEPWQVFANQYEIYHNRDGYVKSESWSGGGDWRDCWEGGGIIHPDSEPEYMNELYDLLKKIDETTDHYKYKVIHNSVVWEDEDYENDYYGGSEKRIRHVFSVESLYKMLVTDKLIEAIT